MIGSLKGTVEALDNPAVIVDVKGVGYKVIVYENLFAKLKVKDKLKLFTYTHVKEDALELFGFDTLDDLSLFESLIKVSGIGPKTAINIFSFGKRSQIVEAIVKGDVSFFTAVPRLGRKNAQKIIIELKNKLGSTKELDLSGKDQIENKEVVAALRSFGFSASEAERALSEIKTQNLKTEEKIKLALRHLGGK